MKDRGSVTADFNNYISPGIYGYDGGPSVLNAPGSVAGNLEVIVTTRYVIQRITVYDRTYTRRYNGSVWTDWASYLTNVDFQCGVINVPIKTANTATTVKLTFPRPYSAAPVVVCSPLTGAPAMAHASPQSVSSTSCNIVGIRTSGTEALDVFWIACAK